MPYATQQQLIDRFGEPILIRLTDRAELATETIDATVVDRALADTDAIIDGYLASRYALPLASTPALVLDLALAIAIYKLHIYRPDEKIEADYKDALSTLTLIAKGVVKLDLAGVEPETTGADGAQVTDRERPFTEDNMKGFI